MTEKLSPHWLVFDVSMRHEDSKSLGGWQETLIHFTGLKRAKTKLNNLRSEHFEKSDVEPGLLSELLTLTQLKVVHFVEISERAKNNSIQFLFGNPYSLPPSFPFWSSGCQIKGPTQSLLPPFPLLTSRMSVEVNHEHSAEVVYCLSSWKRVIP